MAWPRKIGLFGRGEGKMQVTSYPPAHVMKKMAEGANRRGKRQFIQDAVLAMLAGRLENLPATNRRPKDLVDRAEDIYNLIEERVTSVKE